MQAPAESRPPGTLTAVLWAAAERWGYQIFSFAVFAVLARLLEPTAFGLVALASLCLSFFTILIDQGVGTAIVRLRHVESKHLSSSFWMALGISLILLAVTVLLAPLSSRLVGAEELTPVLRVLALSLPIAALTTVPVAILTRQLGFETLTKRAILGMVVGGVAGVVAAALGCGVWSLVIQQITTAVIGTLILWTAVRWRPSIEISVRHLRDVGAIAVAVVFNAVAWFVCQRADQAIVGAGIGPAELAAYAVAMKLIVLVIELVCAPVTRVALPMLSQRQEDGSAFEASYVRLTAGSVLLGVPGLVGLALVAPEGIGIVLGDNWQRSAVVIRLLLGYGVIRVLFNLFDSAMIARGKTILYMTLLLLTATTTVLASLVGLAWGLEGVAMAATVNILIHGVVGLVVLQRFLGIRVRVFAASIAPLLVSCACMAVAVVLVRATVLSTAPAAVLLVGSIFVGALVYGAAVYVLAPGVAGDVRRIAGRLTAARPIGP